MPVSTTNYFSKYSVKRTHVQILFDCFTSIHCKQLLFQLTLRLGLKDGVETRVEAGVETMVEARFEVGIEL